MNGFLGFLKWRMGVFLLTGRQHFDFFQTTACAYFNTYPRLGFQSFFFLWERDKYCRGGIHLTPAKTVKIKICFPAPSLFGDKVLDKFTCFVYHFIF